MDPTQGSAGIVQQAFAAYLDQDRPAMERLLADELAFSSPQDDHIGRDEYLAKCFPTAERLVSQVLQHVVPVDDEHVMVVYEYELKTGGTFRNAELHTVHDGQIHEIQVFFGGEVARSV